MNSVAVEEVALAARFLAQVASLASRHGQFTVRAAFFCSPHSIPAEPVPCSLAILSPVILEPWKGVDMRRTLLCLAIGMLTVAGYAQWVPDEDVPAYHATPPVRGTKLPPLLSGSQLTGPMFQYPWQKAVYVDAAKIPQVLYQLPCYCRCDRNMGHSSLHSCFEGMHGAECSTCAKEGFFAYQMTLKGESVSKIRAQIMAKEFESIDLNSIGM